MVEMHEYDEKNANTCQHCKDNKEKYENEDAQVSDYHVITPITPKKRTGVDATLADLYQGKNVKFKKGFYPSQLDAIELATSSDEKSNKGGRRSKRTKRSKKSKKSKRTKRSKKTMKRRRRM
jgi:hypothetical protein